MFPLFFPPSLLFFTSTAVVILSSCGSLLADCPSLVPPFFFAPFFSLVLHFCVALLFSLSSARVRVRRTLTPVLAPLS